MKKEERNPTATVIRYNWNIIKKYTNNNPRLSLDFLSNVYVRKTENYMYLNPWAAKIVVESKDKRYNFIKEIPGLIEASRYCTDSELFIYLDLCSLRNYFTFINTKGKVNYLPIWKVADRYNVDELSMNRLLTLDDKNIYLIYEGD
jgi:hypothetical protein